MTDEDLIRNCLKRDRNAQRLLYDRFAATMYAICVRYTHRREDARDVLQDGFIKVFRSLDTFRFQGSLEGWIKRIFIHTSINQYRKRKSLETFFTPMEEHFDLHEETVDAISQISEKELLDCISRLPDGYRLVFNLHVLEGYDHNEIGALLQIKPSTSRSQLLKARRMLQQQILEMKLIKI